MTRSASPTLRIKFEVCLGIIRHASLEMLTLLKVYTVDGKDPRGFLEQLETARLNLGNWAAVARLLNLNDTEMSTFTLHLRHLQQLVPDYESGQDVSDNQMIAALRCVSSLEYVREKQPLLHYSIALDNHYALTQEDARCQIHAIELMIKGLIEHAWPDRIQRLQHLKALFGAEKVRRWLRMAKGREVLNGMLFSELALLLVDKKEYARHYDSVFQSAPSLSFMPEPRKTLQAFLDDIRLYRNAIIDGQPLTHVQSILLEVYFHAITAPIQQAFSKGHISLDPGTLFNCDEAELTAFFDRAREKNSVVGGDIFDIRGGIERPEKLNARSREERQQLISGVLWGVVGMVFIGIVCGVLFLASNMSDPPPLAQPKMTGHDGHTLGDSSSRDMLANLGISWDENNLRAAIDRNDIRVVRLFLQAGMEWKLAWTEQALAEGHDETLSALLTWRHQMVENQPCRRMIATMSQALVTGGILTSMRRHYLRTFCTAPVVVQRQLQEVELARQRADASGTKEARDWAATQQTLYDVIH